MKDSINDNKTLVLLLGILSLVILSALYYYVVYPKIEREKTTKHSIEQLTIETERLQREIALFEEETEAPTNLFEIRKKLPATRAVSELLLSLQEAELVSGAHIQSIMFNNYDGLVSESGYGVTGEEELDEAGKTAIEVEEEVPETEIDVEALPPSLKLLSFSLQVEVQDYDHLLFFIKEIEAMERVKRIEDISFSQGGEPELEVKNADEKMTVMLQVTTFYSEEEVD